MVNSITLSTDMTTLYLIDNGRAISFPLSKEKMILVGVLKGQITVATSLPPEQIPDSADLPSDTEEMSVSGTLRRGGAGEEVKVPANPESQWTVLFNQKFLVMALIGAVEINPGLTPEDPKQPDPKIFTFSLKELVVGITRQGNALVFTPMRRHRVEAES